MSVCQTLLLAVLQLSSGSDADLAAPAAPDSTPATAPEEGSASLREQANLPGHGPIEVAPPARRQEGLPMASSLHALLRADYQKRFLSPGGSGKMQLSAAALQWLGGLGSQVQGSVFVNFAQGRLVLLEAWGEARLHEALTVRVGLSEVPYTQETLTSPLLLPFSAPSMVAATLPSTDLGVHVYGAVADGLLNYNFAVVAGRPAGALSLDRDFSPDFVARLLLQPFRFVSLEALQWLRFGIGGGYGSHRGQAYVPRYQWFYEPVASADFDDTVAATGHSWRVTPHAGWSYGPWVAYGNYLIGKSSVQEATLETQAWSGTVAVMLTGEPGRAFGHIEVARPLTAGGPGALRLSVGGGGIDVNTEDFFVELKGVDHARLVGAGVMWYPVTGMALLIDYGRLFFQGASPGYPVPDRSDFIVGRFELAL